MIYFRSRGVKPSPNLALSRLFPGHFACLQLPTPGQAWGYSLTLFRPSTNSTQVSMLSMGFTASCCDTSFQSLHSGIRSR